MQNKRRIGVYLLKHYAGMALLMLLLAFFLVPFRVLLDCVRNAEMIRSFGGDPGLLVQDMRRHFSSLLNLAGSQELLSLAFAAMGYFSGIFLFRHLFSGKRTVLEAGLPVKKGTDFLLRSLVYGIDSLLPVILSLALVPVLAGIAGTGGFLSADVFRQCMVLALMHLYGYAVGALSAVMTGQLWACAAVTLTLSAGMEGMLCCWQNIAVHYLFTMPLDAARTWMSTWSPAFSLYKALLRTQAFAPTAGIAATAVFLVLAFVLYRKRAAERTGHSVAFAGLELPGMILASLGSGTLCGMIFMNIIDSEAALLVSLVLGAVLGYMLFRGLILLNMKKAFTFVPLGVACAMVLAAGVFALRFDLAGYDRYVPEAGQLRSVSVRAEGDGGDIQQYTLRSADAIEAACTLGRQLREITVAEKGYHPVMFDSFVVEYRSEKGSHRRNYVSRRNAAGMPDPEAYSAAAKVMVESEDFRQDALAGLSLDEFEAALDQADAASDLGRFSIYAYVQSYGPSVNQWTMALDFKEGGGEILAGKSPEEVRHLLEVARRTIMGRRYETLGQNPICTYHLSGRGIDRYLNATIRVYPGETELLAIWLGDKAEEAEKLLTGGFVSVCDCEVVRLHYAAPDVEDSQNPGDGRELISVKAAGSPEEAAEWIRNSISGNGMERYYMPAISADEIWLLEKGDGSAYSEMTGTAPEQETELTERIRQIQENPELYAWPQQRYIVSGH